MEIKSPLLISRSVTRMLVSPPSTANIIYVSCTSSHNALTNMNKAAPQKTILQDARKLARATDLPHEVAMATCRILQRLV